MRNIETNPHRAMSPEARGALIRSLCEIEALSFSDPWSEAMFADSLDNPLVRLVTLTEEGALVAYCLFAIVSPEAELLNLAVVPEMRKRGIARTLLSEALTALELESVDTVFLEVRESNIPARAFYDSLGFIPVGRRKHYYRYPTEDAVVMLRRPD